MLLTIAIIAVVVLLAVALLPIKKREPEQLRQASPVAFLPQSRHNRFAKQRFVSNSSMKKLPPLPLNTNDAPMRFGSMKYGRRPRSC